MAMDAPRPDDEDALSPSAAAPHPPLARRAALRREAGQEARVDDILAAEVAVALVYNGISHAVMMASPADLEDFATGFSLAEGIVERAGEIRDLRRSDGTAGISLDMEIPPARFARLKDRRRALTGRTGCGLCGVDSLDAALRAPPVVGEGPRISGDALAQAMSALAAGQVLNRDSHAVHAAGWASPDGRLLLLREDVGRHNAVDKLTGALARGGLDPAGGILLVTSRCSYEIVHKAASAGIAIVAAVSAPTELACRLAEDAGVTLAAFVRGERHSLYTHAARIAP